MLIPFAEEIWTAAEPVVSVAGFRYPTRMAVLRLTNGELFVWSPTALSEDLRSAVDRLGPVRHLIAPNTLHYRHLADWARCYPHARTCAPRTLRSRLPHLRLHADLDDAPDDAWAADIDQTLVSNLITTEAVFFHRPSATVIITDLLQQFTPGWFTGWRAIVARMDLMTQPEPAVPRKFRLAFRDRAAARAAVRHVLAWPAENLLLAHGAPIHGDGHVVLTRAFAWLHP